MKLIPNWFSKMFLVCGPHHSHDWKETGDQWLCYEQTPNWHASNNLNRTCRRCGKQEEARYTPSMSGRSLMAWYPVA